VLEGGDDSIFDPGSKPGLNKDDVKREVFDDNETECTPKLLYIIIYTATRPNNNFISSTCMNTVHIQTHTHIRICVATNKLIVSKSILPGGRWRNDVSSYTTNHIINSSFC